MYDGGVVFDLDVCVQVQQFVDVYEMVFEDCFVDYVDVVGYVVECYELCLYVGWKCGVWCGGQVDCFWLFVLYVQGDGVFGGFDFCVGFDQFGQYCVYGVWVCMVDCDFVVGYCCSDQEGIGFDVVGQYFVVVVGQMFDVFDDQVGSVQVFDFCVQCDQVMCQIGYFWFYCVVVEDGGVFGQYCVYQYVFGVGDIDYVEGEMVVFKLFGVGFDEVVFDYDFGIQCLQVFDVLVDWM